MTPSTMKRISKVCKVFAIVWFAGLVLLEAWYVLGIARAEAKLRHYHILRVIYEDQNFLMIIVLLVPGALAWLMYLRFRREH
jgi:hypothetical protein